MARIQSRVVIIVFLAVGIVMGFLWVVGQKPSPQDREILEKAQNGDAEAQIGLGESYLLGERGKYKKEANEWFRKAAAVIYPSTACTDKKEGIKWLRKAAEQGNAEAQRRYGSIFFAKYKPRCVGIAYPKRDVVEAIKWWRKAAEQGNLGAQVNLGSIYSSGGDIETDRLEACRWYRMAAEQGSRSSKEKIKDC